jgi:hypothetical protein
MYTVPAVQSQTIFGLSTTIMQMEDGSYLRLALSKAHGQWELVCNAKESTNEVRGTLTSLPYLLTHYLVYE